MPNYELDRLGFFQFEWLIHTLLRADLGLQFEAWGGRGDNGRDAYSPTSLLCERTQMTYLGPIVVQAKFVSNANAAGAKPTAAIKAACEHELQLIRKRKQEGKWGEVRTYLLYTNVELTPTRRAALSEIFSRELGFPPILCGKLEVSADLDRYPEIARNFPQILTYQNLLGSLERLVSTSLQRDVRAKTEIILSRAQELIPVFVPTAAYERAWKVLLKHHFVFLSGPPEMGKTSISWMMALAQLAVGWQVVDCSEPEDFFRLVDRDIDQIFLADDAFGRTEYDPQRGRQWERRLPDILRRLDAKHLLVWTSRKHILERALTGIDLGSHTSFPSPAEVTVQAEQLSFQEKALIVYRHAVAASLEEEAKAILKEHVREVLQDPHFTPLRIALFIRNELPAITARAKAKGLKKYDVSIAIAAAIREVTSEMEKTFHALSPADKWLLVTLLDEGQSANDESIQAKFSAIADVPLTRSVNEMLDELDEAFLKVTR